MLSHDTITLSKSLINQGKVIMEYKNQHGSNSTTANNSSNHNVATEIKNEYAQCKRQLAKYQNSTTATCVAVAILAAPLALTILFTASTDKNFELLSIAVSILLIAISLSVVAVIRVYKRNKLSKREWQLRKEYTALKSIIGKDKVLDVNSISRDEISLLNTSDESQQNQDTNSSGSRSLGRTILAIIVSLLIFGVARWIGKQIVSPTTNNRPAITRPAVQQPTTTTTQPTVTQPTYTQPTYTQPQSVHCSSHTIGESTYTNCY